MTSPPPSPPPEPAADPEPPDPGPQYGTQTEAVRLKERIYAVITMIAVLVALTDDDTLTTPGAAWSIAGTALGVWLATLVADLQAQRVVRPAAARHGHLRMTLYTTVPQLLSAVVPLLFTALAGLGLLALQTALLAAVAVELAGLFAWGLLGGLRLGGNLLTAVAAGTADLVIGVIIVSVKVAVSH